MATSYPARKSVQATVTSGTTKIIRSPQSDLPKLGIAAIGGSPVVKATMSSEADIVATTATWVTLSLTGGQVAVDNIFTAFSFQAVSADAKCGIVH